MATPDTHARQRAQRSAHRSRSCPAAREMDGDILLRDELQLRTALEELLFWDANDALGFKAQRQPTGAINVRRKLTWRYNWA